MSTAIIRHTSPSHRFGPKDLVYVKGAGGIEPQSATVLETVLVAGEPGYRLLLSSGKEDLAHVDLVQRKPQRVNLKQLSAKAQEMGLGQQVTSTSEGLCLDGEYRLGHTEAEAYDSLARFHQGRQHLQDYLRARRLTNPEPLPESAKQNYKGQPVPAYFFTHSSLRHFAYGSTLSPQLLRLWSTDAARKVLHQESQHGRAMEPFHQLLDTARLFEAGAANDEQLEREFRLCWDLLQSYEWKSAVQKAGKTAIEASRESAYSGGWLPDYFTYMTEHAGYTEEEAGQWLGARLLWLEGYQATAGERGLLLLLQGDEPVYSPHASVRTTNPWGHLTDGREVYWMKERTPTSAERLTELLGHPVTWEGFLSKAEKARRGLSKDGFVMVVDGREIGLGRSVDEAIQSSNAHIIARNKAIFSGSLGEMLRQQPELLKQLKATDPGDDLQAVVQFIIREVEQFENYHTSTTERQDGYLVEIQRRGEASSKKIGSFRVTAAQVSLSGVDGLARKRLSRIHRLAQKLHENLKPLSREANPASPASYGYRSEADLQLDLARLARDLPSGYEPPSGATKGSFQVGNGTDVFVVTKDGVEIHRGRYLLVEAHGLEASHIPTDIGPFGVNPRYPEGVQERRYHKDPQEAAKVRNNARRFMPGLVINTNPDAVNGPPIVDSHMIVLGGNSRTMTQQLLYSQGKGDAIKNFLAASCSAGCFGFTPDDVQAMKAPILVRQIDFEAKSDKEKARYLVRVLNEVMTQDLDFASEVTAVANKLTRGQWRQIAQFIASHKADEDTLNSYLLKTASSEFVQLLYELGVLTDRNLSKLVFQNKEKRNYGLLNRFGRRMVSELFLGYLLQSPELIEQMNDQALMVFETIAPYLIVSACCDPAWDLTEDVRIALQAVTAAVIKKDDIYRVMGQLDLFGGESSYSAVQDNPRRKFLFHVLFAYRNSPAKMSKGFKRYAMRASGTNEAAMSLPGTVVETQGGESLQELALAFQATPEDPDKGGSPSGFRLPHDPVLRKQNPEQDISFDLPAKGGKTRAVTGVYDTETGHFTPDTTPYARALEGQIMDSSGDAGRAWRAMNLLTAAQGMTSEASWQQAARIIEDAIASGIMSEASFQEVRGLLFGEATETTSQTHQPQQSRMAALQGMKQSQDEQKKREGWVQAGDGHWTKPPSESQERTVPETAFVPPDWLSAFQAPERETPLTFKVSAYLDDRYFESLGSSRSLERAREGIKEQVGRGFYLDNRDKATFRIYDGATLLEEWSGHGELLYPTMEESAAKVAPAPQHPKPPEIPLPDMDELRESLRQAITQALPGLVKRYHEAKATP